MTQCQFLKCLFFLNVFVVLSTISNLVKSSKTSISTLPSLSHRNILLLFLQRCFSTTRVSVFHDAVVRPGRGLRSDRLVTLLACKHSCDGRGNDPVKCLVPVVVRFLVSLTLCFITVGADYTPSQKRHTHTEARTQVFKQC